MLPNPLHPAVVHFPVVLVVLLPLFALAALWMIRRGTAPRLAWALPLTVAAALSASAWFAVETGEQQEDRVEAVVSESAMHTHEEAAERFLVLSGILLLVATAGMAAGNFGRAGRIVSTVGTFGLVAAGIQVGHSGGELVYKRGAASAYTQDGSGSTPSDRPQRQESEDEETAIRTAR